MINDVYTTTEASKLWNLDESTVKKACQKGLFNNEGYRKSENTWLVTRYAMYERYGAINGEDPATLLKFNYTDLTANDFTLFNKFIDKMQSNAHSGKTSFKDIAFAKIDIIRKEISVEIQYQTGLSVLNVRRMFLAGINKVLVAGKLT